MKLNKGTKKFIGKKIMELIVTLFVVTIISFLLMRLSPVDPAIALARRTFTYADPERVEGIREQLGLNRPLMVQYISWVKNAFCLDFGKSFVNGRDVLMEVAGAISITASVVLISAVIQAVGILTVSCLCYITRNNFVGRILDFLCIAGISIPPFFLACTFIDVFAVKLRMLSVAGNSGLMRYIPAAICLAVSGIGFFSQLLSKEIEKAMKEDSAFYARCRGFKESRILISHALVQAVAGLLPSFMQMIGLAMAGATIVERVFSLPGLGYLIVDSVLYRDAPMIHATILFLAFGLVIFNIISDVLRRRLQGENIVKEGIRS